MMMVISRGRLNQQKRIAAESGVFDAAEAYSAGQMLTLAKDMLPGALKAYREVHGRSIVPPKECR
jgi:hypothetical protein